VTVNRILEAVENCLTADGVCVLRAFAPERRQRHGHSFCVLGLRSLKLEEPGLGSYLGVETDKTTGASLARYGRRLTAKVGLDLYAAPEEGAESLEALFRQTADLLLNGPGIEGMTELEREALAYDSETECLRIRCALGFTGALVCARSDSGENFTDFRLGELTIHV